MSTSQRMVIIGLWLVWLIYWIASAGTKKNVIRAESDISRKLQSYPLIAGGLLLETPHLGGLMDAEYLPGASSSVYWYWSCVALVVIGLGFTVWARRHLGSNWSVAVILRENHELIRSGPYGLVRHPIYSGALLAILGAALAGGQWRGLIGVALIASSLIYKVSLEERWLGELFGDAYKRYRSEVSALVPGVY